MGNGRPVRESTGTAKDKEAERFLKQREGAVATGAPIPPRLDRILFDELATDLRTFYQTTGRRRLDEVEDRLTPLSRFFAGRRAASIGPAFVTPYVAERQSMRTRAGHPPANRTINIELALLRRCRRLAYKNNKLLRVPPFDMLKDAPAPEGFFEAAQYEAVRRRLPEDLQVAVAIAHTYGWRIKSEVLSLERRHLDLEAGTLRLDPGVTKNAEGRVIYLTPELKGLLIGQVRRVEQLSRRLGRIVSALFPHPRGGLPASAAVGSPSAGARRATRRASPAGCCTTSGGPLSAIWSGLAWPDRSP